VLSIDCSELSADEKLALAGKISDDLDGAAIALVKDESIVLDVFAEEPPDASLVRGAVEEFIARRKDGAHYSIEVTGERIVVHSADPVAAMKKKPQNNLPPNVMMCHYCPFITEHQEELTVHERTHLFGA
jgi:hypothetical protein